MIKNDKTNIDEKYKRFEKIHDKIKFKAFGKVWEIKKKDLGGKKTDVEATAIINPKTGNLALSKGEIKKVSLQYTKETLMRNPIEEGVAEEIEQKKVAKRKFQISRATENTLCYGIYSSNRKNHWDISKWENI